MQTCLNLVHRSPTTCTRPSGPFMAKEQDKTVKDTELEWAQLGSFQQSLRDT